MRKFKFLTAILSLMVFFGSLTACQFSMVPPSSSSTHTCKSVCPECEKCLDAECEEEACLEKCDCEETSEHTCESACIICNGCTNEDCEEEACLEKCQGHDTPHTCESECPECGKCMDAECEETVCADKCQGHHICESICRDCEKCMDKDCEEEACAEKCKCQATPDPDPAHTCESVCETCGKCMDATCTEEACADKCQGHTVTPPAHTCESVCETCGKCEDLTCTEEACAEKCEGHTVTPPAHTCQNPCPDCGKCMNADCEEAVCEEKCEGHTGDVEGTNWTSFDLNFVSFNILIPGAANTVADWDKGRGTAVINFINTCGADIIGLQEVNTVPHKQIPKALPSKYEYIYTMDNCWDAMIYDNTVFDLLDTDIYFLSDTPEQDVDGDGWGDAQDRMAAVLFLRHRETGEKVKAINTHGYLNDSGNTKGFNLISERSLSDDEYMFTVMLGDFNARPTSTNMGYQIIEKKLLDCRLAAKESPNRDTSTCHVDSATKEWGKAVGRYIDFIFVTKSEDVEVLYYEVREDKWGDNQYMSDHNPIQAKVRIYNRNHAWSDFY